MSIRIDYAPMNNAPTTAETAIVRMSEYIYATDGKPVANEMAKYRLQELKSCDVKIASFICLICTSISRVSICRCG